MSFKIELVGSGVSVVILYRPVVHMLLQGLEHTALKVDFFTRDLKIISTKFSGGLGRLNQSHERDTTNTPLRRIQGELTDRYSHGISTVLDQDCGTETTGRS